MSETFNLNKSNRNNTDRDWELMQYAKIGWWETRTNHRALVFSESLCRLLEIEGGTLSFDDAMNRIRADFRDVISDEFQLFITHHSAFSEPLVPFDTPHGEIWLRIQFCKAVETADGTEFFGYAHEVGPSAREKSAIKDINANSLLSQELAREKQNALLARKDYDGVIEVMPIGYSRMKVIRNELGEISDYQVVKINNFCRELFNVRSIPEGWFGSKEHSRKYTDEILSFIRQLVVENKEIDHNVLTPSGRYCHHVAFILTEDEVSNFYVDADEMVTSHMQADRNLEFFKQVFMAMPIGVSMFDTDTRPTFMNHAFMNIFGITKMDSGYLFRNDTNLGDEVKNKLEHNEVSFFRIKYDYDQANYKFKTDKHGTAILNIKCYKIQTGSEKYSYIILCLSDEDMMISSGRIHDFQNLFSLISDYAKVGYCKYNLLSHDGFAVSQWFRNVGEKDNVTLDRIIGTYPNIHPDDRDQVIAFIDKARKGKAKRFSIEARVRRPGCRDKWNWVYSNMLVTDYKPSENRVIVISVNYDITEYKNSMNEFAKARDKAQKADRLKSAFLANMSHEIRTPLNAIVGFSNLISDADNDEDRKTFVNIINQNNNQLLQIINDILDLSKIEAGTMEYRLTDMDLVDMCRNISRSLQIKAAEGVRIVFEPQDEHFILFTDSTHIEQVISNFVNNAIKFTTKGTITIAYERLDELNIRISVTDTGIGIDKEAQRTIFDRFVKLNTFAPGTGLGLAICSSIIRDLGGDIGVTSELGKGSCFWFIIPVRCDN